MARFTQTTYMQILDHMPTHWGQLAWDKGCPPHRNYKMVICQMSNKKKTYVCILKCFMIVENQRDKSFPIVKYKSRYEVSQ